MTLRLIWSLVNGLKKIKMNNIEIKTKSEYLPELSDNNKDEFYFAYKIKIYNKSIKKVQLLSRHWNIEDSLGRVKVVDGEGVIGEQPVILPGQHYEYKSFCPLNTNFGVMKGFYTMKDDEGKIFKVAIPEFGLISNNYIN